MGGICFICSRKLGFMNGTGFTKQKLLEIDKIPPKNMSDEDRMCGKCYEKHPAKKKQEQDSQDVEDFIENQKNEIQENKEQDSTNLPIGGGNTPVTETKPMTETVSASLSEITSVKQLTNITDQRHNEFKAMWQKGRVVQFKNDKIAILMRAHASQVQFIVAFDQVTREGFRLMAIDEGKEASAGGFTGGVSSYYYFQKMDYVR